MAMILSEMMRLILLDFLFVFVVVTLLISRCILKPQRLKTAREESFLKVKVIRRNQVGKDRNFLTDSQS